jgi:hypothetical protein
MPLSTALNRPSEITYEPPTGWSHRHDKSPRCVSWPNCGCAKRWQMFEQLDQFGLDEFEADWAEMELRHMLRCIELHCPDLLFRAQARKQMRKNGWQGW